MALDGKQINPTSIQFLLQDQEILLFSSPTLKYVSQIGGLHLPAIAPEPISNVSAAAQQKRVLGNCLSTLDSFWNRNNIFRAKLSHNRYPNTPIE